MEFVKEYEKIVLSSVDSFVQNVSSAIHQYVEDYKTEMVGKTLRSFQFPQGSVDVKVEVCDKGEKKFFLLVKSKCGEVKRIDFTNAIKITFKDDGGRSLQFEESLSPFCSGESGVVADVKLSSKKSHDEENREKNIEDAFNKISGSSNPSQPYPAPEPEPDSSHPSSYDTIPPVPVPEPQPQPQDDISTQVEHYAGMYLSQIQNLIENSPYTANIEMIVKSWYDNIMKTINNYYSMMSTDSQKLLKELEAYYSELSKNLSSMISNDSQYVTRLESAIEANYKAIVDYLQPYIANAEHTFDMYRNELMAKFDKMAYDLQALMNYIKQAYSQYFVANQSIDSSATYIVTVAAQYTQTA